MKTFWQSCKIFLLLTLLTGVLYPLVITGIVKIFFNDKADGSIMTLNGKPIGSQLIAQKFTNPAYFWPRPSVTDYNPLPSGGSNLSATSSDLAAKVQERTATLRQTNPDSQEVPTDLLFASGSGLDPHISPQAAAFQIERIVHARVLDPVGKKALIQLMQNYSELPTFGFLGEPRVNVFKLNVALDSLFRTTK